MANGTEKMLFARDIKNEAITLEEVRRFVRKLASSRALKIEFDTDLADNGLLDSVAMMELLLWLEQDQGVIIPDDQLLPENFRSIRVLHAFIQEFVQ